MPDTDGTKPQPGSDTPALRTSTVPVGTPADPETAAVKLTIVPASAGLMEATSPIVGLILLTTCDTVFEVLPEYVAFPEYTPVIDCVPLASAVVAQVATPEPLSAAVPQPVMVVPLARKLTVPAGVPELPVTVAVKVTDWPTLEGLTDDVSAVLLAASTTQLPPTEPVPSKRNETFDTQPAVIETWIGVPLPNVSDAIGEVGGLPAEP